MPSTWKISIWKIGSRWDDNGHHQYSVLDAFRKYKIIALGRYRDAFRKDVSVGDIFAVSDGIRVVAVCKVLRKLESITEIEIAEDDLTTYTNEGRNFYHPDVVGAKVEWYDLDNDDVFRYTVGAFHAVHKYHDKLIELYNKYSNR